MFFFNLKFVIEDGNIPYQIEETWLILESFYRTKLQYHNIYDKYIHS